MKTAIIGSGIGGLATAIRLAVRGHEVTVFEKNDHPGGKISELRTGSYRFDTGPSLFTLPQLAEELFEMCGENPAEWIPHERLETNCKYFFPDCTVFNFYQDRDKLTKELHEKMGSDDAECIFHRLEKSREIYELSAPVFLFSSFRKLSNFNTPAYKRIAPQLYKLDFFRTMHQANRYEFSDTRMMQIFDRYATYNGSNPYKAPATLNMIAHLENNIGAFFPKKGMYSIVDSLYRLAVKKGVNFRFNTKVDRIITKDKKATGVITPEGFEEFDIIISDADAKYVASRLLPKHPLKSRLEKAEPSSSALIFYWGVERTYPELELHNILFSRDYHMEFRKIFREQTLYHDPTVYIFISSKLVEGDAPEGHENWFVMVNAPANSGQDWNKLVANARRNIITKIRRILRTNIEKYIVSENIASPLTIEQNTMSTDGALYGTSSNSMFSAFLRHPNFLSSIQNLYFVGGSVHPGGGIPLCLASAQIVDNEISEKYDQNTR